MGAKRNKRGKTWREHAAPYLSRALKQASTSWKPKSQRTNKKKLAILRAKKEKLGYEIKKELEKG